MNQEVLGPPWSHFQEPMPFKEMVQVLCIDILLLHGMNQALRRENGLWGSKPAQLVTSKVTRLERNALLGRVIDLNSLTWLLVTCVLFQMYTTPALGQPAFRFYQCDYNGTPIKCIYPSSTLCTSLLVLGGRRYHVIRPK